jgi:hypothetical protein
LWLSGISELTQETAQTQPETLPPPLARRQLRPLGGIILVVLASFAVLYGLYLFQFKPMLSMRLPKHQPLPLDSPPTELTSFQVRANGRVMTPQNVADGGDSIYLSFVEQPIVQIYSKTLKLLGSLQLDKPAPITPTAIAVTDSQLIVADTIKGLVAVFDRDGGYVNSVAWYPGRKVRLRPTQLATDGRLLTVIDPKAGQVAVISLITFQPFYDFLELMDIIPGEDRTHLRAPAAAIIAPEGSIWIADQSGRGMIYTPTGDFVNELEQPTKTNITSPVAFAVALSATDAEAHEGLRRDNIERVKPQEVLTYVPKPEQIRIHLLDNGSGKVYVYDLSGRLKLVYPQDRDLQQPTAIAINSTRRQIFITEGGTQSITVFGY